MKKSKEIKKSSLYKIYDDRGETYTGSKSEILDIVGNALEGMASPIAGRNPLTLTFEWDWVDDGKEASAKKMKKSTEALIFCNDKVYLTRSNGYPDYILNDLNDALDRYDERCEALEDQGFERCWDSGREWMGNVSHYYKIEGQNGYLEEIPKDEARQLMIQLYGEDRYYNSSAKKMKKAHGNYVDAIENSIVDSDGVYCNEIIDEFSDVLSEDEVMDALDQLIEEGIICYNENNEKLEVCAKAKKSYTPNYLGFRDMVGKMRNTRNYNKVFKE